ncbi:hypothetical protein EDC64_1031 [Aquabacter spiritensis]|uniref:Uncharacterized protein n=2 Tax=Aquabacter spiritensis TaxID=933073 RepID=A0A4R3LYW2_9HYPH|nr:hypothetical protein EDC64_1031 [Aquabacter spiritensis]
MDDGHTRDEATRDRHPLRSLISGGAEIAGGAVGGALGFLAAGPVGAAALGAGGALAAMALSHIGEEIAGRFLGPREKVRVGGVLALSASKIKERVQAGEQIRDDGFFDAKPDGRPDAEEVAESILLKAQREAEEKKLPYMANLLTNVAFDNSVNGQLAHQIVKAAEALTYRQLCLLSLFSGLAQHNLRSSAYRDVGEFPLNLMQVLYECYDLYNRGLVNVGGEVAFGPTDIKPSVMRIQGLGAFIFNLMGLAKIPPADVAVVASELRWRSSLTATSRHG